MRLAPFPLVGVLVAAACSLPGPTPRSSLPGGAAPRAAALRALHAEVRVPGLDDRRFAPERWWSAVTPFLEDPIRVEELGTSAEGRPIRMVSFGSGPTHVLLWSQMHGDESTASMALADLLNLVHDRPDDALVRTISRGATVHLIPILNPDGAARFQRRNAQGIDVNRDARRLQTPEGRILKAAVDRIRPAFGFNLHDQDPATRVGDTDRGVAIALLAPAFNEARDVDDKRRRAMQVATVLVESLEPMVGGHIAKYDDTFNPRAFGDLVGAWGASTVLIESGGWADDPQKQYLREANFVGLLAALDAIATRRFDDADPAVYDSLPFNGRRVADLLVEGATVVVPGLPELRADLLVNYDRPLLRQGGVFADIGDLQGVEAQDTLDASGLFVIPFGDALDAGGGLSTGRPARFLLAEDPQGSRVRLRFDGGPPAARTAPGGERPD